MTLACYGHLRFKTAPLVLVIGVSRFTALFDYIRLGPANRIFHGHFPAAALKTLQQVITLAVLRCFR